MNKTLVLGLALSLVLFSGAMYTAQADCGCLPHINLCNISPCNWFSCGAARDKDLSDYNPYPQRVHSLTFGCSGSEQIQ